MEACSSSGVHALAHAALANVSHVSVANIAPNLPNNAMSHNVTAVSKPDAIHIISNINANVSNGTNASVGLDLAALHNMHNHSLAPLIVGSNFAGVLPNGVTLIASPMLTPTTFAMLEQTLAELQNREPNGMVSAAIRNMAQGGAATDFAPPAMDRPEAGMSMKRDRQAVENVGDPDSDESSSDEEDWSDAAGSKRQRTAEGGDYSVTSPGYTSTDSSGANTSGLSTTSVPRRHTGPRRPRRDEKLTPEEIGRRVQRRERNKVAAAKCRQKRVDLTNELQQETEGLEAEQSRLQEEIKAFQQQKEELEFILEAHRLHCGVGAVAGSSVQTSQPTATPPLMPPLIKVEDVPSVPPSVTMVPPPQPNRRPNSFAVPARASTLLPQVDSGLPTTPLSNTIALFAIGLQSMMDGHTGLTPITGMPSIVGQSTPQSAIVGGMPAPEDMPENLSSPTTSHAASLTTL